MKGSTGSLKPGNGSTSLNGKMNGQAAAQRRPAQRKRRFVPYLISAVARLATWAVIFTILFRCPSSLEACDESSPIICEHYFKAKQLVSPYTQPLYDEKIAPYIDYIKPYYEAADNHLLTPARAYAVEYGTPLVEKGRQHALKQWEKLGLPQLAETRAQLDEGYNYYIAPPLTRAIEFLEPYYEIGRTSLLRLFYDVLLPLLELTRPYALQGYETASTFATDKALPVARWTWNKTTAFLYKAVWSQIRIVYVENVEPQLVRIGERLERYKNKTGTGAKSRSNSAVSLQPSSTGASKKPAEPAQSTVSKPAPQSTTTTPSASAAAEKKTSFNSAVGERSTEPHWNPSKAPVPAENETEQRKKARKMVTEDLDMWQNKFAMQVDEGAMAMEEHVDEIAQRMLVEEVAVTGKDLLKKLESTVESEIDTLKTRILSIMKDLSDDDDADEVWTQIIHAIRSAGMAVKHAAHAVRSWRETYDRDLQAAVSEAANIHFQILDETRGLALQQIGMKWAWTDGVTYKDWTKYQGLKKTLSEWTEELKKLIVTNPNLLKAEDASAQIEDDGMIIASAAAKELVRLKETAHWKLLAKDATDSLDLQEMKLAAEAGQKVTETSQLHDQDDVPKTAQALDNNNNNNNGGKLETTLSDDSELSIEATILKDGRADAIHVEDDQSEMRTQSTSSLNNKATPFLAYGFSLKDEQQARFNLPNDDVQDLRDIFTDPVFQFDLPAETNADGSEEQFLEPPATMTEDCPVTSAFIDEETPVPKEDDDKIGPDDI